MFSQFIQNLLNSGGQTQAMQRYAQLNNRVSSINQEPQNPLDAIYPNNGKINSPSFEKVLQTTTKSNFGTLLLNPQLKQVNASIIKENPQISLDKALQEAAALQSNIPSVNKTSTKSQVLNVVNQISKKYDVNLFFSSAILFTKKEEKYIIMLVNKMK